ncbi:MAG: hypothetical protein ACPIOQ_49070, partial [Promethearchaeia archaeon]
NTHHFSAKSSPFSLLIFETTPIVFRDTKMSARGFKAGHPTLVAARYERLYNGERHDKRE